MVNVTVPAVLSRCGNCVLPPPESASALTARAESRACVKSFAGLSSSARRITVPRRPLASEWVRARLVCCLGWLAGGEVLRPPVVGEPIAAAICVVGVRDPISA